MPASLARREDLERHEREWLAPQATFSDHHGARPHPEEPDPFRTCFVRDRDRVLHSGAFRRLKDKTQVFVIDEGDFYRTRLTHTLEVCQLTRYLCRALRLNESLGEVLALVHDIGHPPFGHEGERVLHELVGPFDHNSQALRIVDTLESPYADRAGLNLTHMVRRMILKHGGEAGRGAEPTRGHVLEAQVADLADRAAYQHHDLEDGLRAGVLSLPELSELSIWRAALAQVGGLPPGPTFPKAVLNQMLKASLRDILERTRLALEECRGRSAEELAAPGRRTVCFGEERGRQHEELGHFLYERFYRHPQVLRSAETAAAALTALVEHFRARPEEMAPDYRRRVDDEGIGRSVCDYVAGMTDRFAIETWQRLAGPRAVIATPALPPEALEPDLAARVSALEQVSGHVFRRKTLAATALRHASARSDLRPPNERLEFLGDAVLGLVVGEELYRRFPDHPEGDLSRMKSTSVSRHALLSVAESWGLSSLLMLGPGFRNLDDTPPSLAADGVEAVLGAIYLDGGLEAVRRVILADFGPLLDVAAEGRRHRNDKSELQSFTQAGLGQTPHYQILGEEGPDHRKLFTVAAVVGGVRVAVASGRNKRQAEQRAAREALSLLRAAAEGRQPLPDGLRLVAREFPPAEEADDDAEAGGAGGG